MVVRVLPSPLEMSEERAEALLCPVSRRFDSLPDATQQLKHGMIYMYNAYISINAMIIIHYLG